MQDIIDRLQAELGERRTPPPAFEIGTTIGAGRRAVRRWRLAVTTAGLALALVMGGTTVAMTSWFTGGQGDDGAVQVAAGVSTEGLKATDGLVDEYPAGYDPQDDDVILVRSGWEVVERIEDPVTGMDTTGGETVTDSVGLDLRKAGTTVWVVLWRLTESDADPGWQGGGGVADTETQSGFDTLTAWLDHQRTLAFTEDGR